MTYNKKSLMMMLAAPAVAGVLVVAGCDNTDDDVTTPAVGTDATAREDMREPPAMDGMRDGMDDAASTAADRAANTMNQGTAAAGQMTDAMKQKLSDLNEQLQEAAEKAKDGMEDNEMMTTALGKVNEASDALQAAVKDGNMTEAMTHWTAIKGMRANLPANIQGMIDQIGQAMPGGGNMPGMTTPSTPATPPATPTPGAGTPR